MSLYSHGRATGVVCEVGEGVSNIIPVVGGIAQKSSILKSDFAGNAVTGHLMGLLESQGIPQDGHLSSWKNTIRDFKENMNGPYILPDGKKIEITQENK